MASVASAEPLLQRESSPAGAALSSSTPEGGADASLPAAHQATTAAAAAAAAPPDGVQCVAPKKGERVDDAFQRALQAADDSLSDDATAFQCNICYELAREPVVTLCGHLYCWPCVYRWMQVQSSCRVCPVCKAGIDEDKVVPIYGRGAGTTDPREKTGTSGKEEPAEVIPRRPAGQRPVPVQRNPVVSPPGAVNSPAGIGIVPTLFGFHHGPGQGGYAEPLTPEQQHQAFLSRLLLMLGSFVIMCLLLF